MLFKVKAIVLESKAFAEADKLVTIFTREKGKLTALAKGARKTKSKFGASLEFFSLNEMLLYGKENRPWDIITDCQIEESFAALRNDLKKMAYASFMVEMVSQFMPEKESLPLLFYLLHKALTLLNLQEANSLLILGFTLRLLTLLGYAPQLKQCLQCARQIDGRQNFRFSLSQGGIICAQCSFGEDRFLPLSISSCKYLRQLGELDLAFLKRLRPSRENEKEMRSLLINYLEHHLERKLKTISFLKDNASL